MPGVGPIGELVKQMVGGRRGLAKKKQLHIILFSHWIINIEINTRSKMFNMTGLPIKKVLKFKFNPQTPLLKTTFFRKKTPPFFFFGEPTSSGSELTVAAALSAVLR